MRSWTTGTARLKLKRGIRHWKGIHDGLALGYRRGAAGSGTWSARLRLDSGRYALQALGTADDYAEANGRDVLHSSRRSWKPSSVSEPRSVTTAA